ncbi:MAG TPA: sulfite exporter TauE/SafE family protein [Kiritimatiellia bacterium]|nr:sulfite exporter TauE/SafE family protein [Kiritimatiellia bacterium]HMO99196.1 sulfite exporter TauE/SafE family protein [Kiritimatiellia bacterium]
MQTAWWMLMLAGVGIGAGAAFTGLGGGFLIVPFLLWLGFSGQQAVGSSALAILIIIASASLAHGRLGNIDYRTALWIGLGGLVGAQLGALLVSQVSTEVFRRIFAAILAALALYLVLKK